MKALAKTLLAIETSGATGSLALLMPDGALLERDFGGPAGAGERPTGHGRELVPAIGALVSEAGLDGSDVGAVAVSAGPGSYTGLRIGVTAAKTLAWALGWELVRVPTLEALAREAAAAGPPEGTRRLVPAVDARQGEVYAAAFRLEGGGVARDTEDAALAPEDLAAALRAGDHVFGSGVERAGGGLAVPDGATSSAGPACPRAGTVARLGAELLARGVTTPPHDAAPAYLRASEAERKASRG